MSFGDQITPIFYPFLHIKIAPASKLVLQMCKRGARHKSVYIFGCKTFYTAISPFWVFLTHLNRTNIAPLRVFYGTELHLYFTNSGTFWGPNYTCISPFLVFLGNQITPIFHRSGCLWGTKLHQYFTVLGVFLGPNYTNISPLLFLGTKLYQYFTILDECLLGTKLHQYFTLLFTSK